MCRIQHKLSSILLCCVLFAILLIIAGCEQTRASQTPVSPASSSAIHLYEDASLLQPDLSYLCRGAGQLAPPFVAIVTVDHYLAAHWTTPDRQRPAGVTNQTVLSTGYSIVTPLHFSQVSVLWDKRIAPTSEFITQGGQVGQDSILVADDHQLELNRSYLVFFEYSLVPHQNVRDHTQLYVASSYVMKTPQTVIVQQKAIEQGQVTRQEKTVPLDYIKQLLTRCVGKPVEQ
jgi:hypothetical protein